MRRGRQRERDSLRTRRGGDIACLAPARRADERLDERDRARGLVIGLRARVGQRQLLEAIDGLRAFGVCDVLLVDGDPRLVGRVIARRDDPADREPAADDHREDRRGRHADQRAVLAHEPHDPFARRVVVRGDELTGQEPLEIVGEPAGVLVPVRAIVRERLVDDRRELGRHTGCDLAQRRGWTLGSCTHHLAGNLRVVRRPACEQVIQRRAERVDVAAFVDGRAAELLGRHEAGGAEHDPGARLERLVVVEHDLCGRRLRAATLARLGAAALRLVGLADRLGEAPVDHDRLARIADEDVRRLDVAMDDPALVCVRDRVRRGDDVRHQRETPGDLGSRSDELLERSAGDLAHHVERRAVRRDSGVVDGHDRRMLEPRGDPRLALESRDRVGIERQRLLHRDGATEHGVRRLDDAAHPAARDLLVHGVAPVGRHLRRGADRHGAARVRDHRGADRCR